MWANVHGRTNTEDGKLALKRMIEEEKVAITLATETWNGSGTLGLHKGNEGTHDLKELKGVSARANRGRKNGGRLKGGLA
jgi:hypothetical protein